MSTAAEMKAELDARGVDYPPKVKNAELEQLLAKSAGTLTEAPAVSTASAKYAGVTIARIDAKIERLQERRERLTRIAARDRSGGNAGKPAAKRTPRRKGTASS